jgi:hypothetical protein
MIPVNTHGDVARRRARWRRLLRGLSVGLLVLGLTGLAAWPATAQDDGAPVRTALADVQQATGYHFLYRDALIAGRTVQLAPGTDSLAALVTALHAQGLTVRVDSARRQVLIAEAPSSASPSASPRVLAGQVVDNATGARLPYATVTWRAAGAQRGVAANEAGAFRLPLEDIGGERTTRVLRVSYVGYRAERVAVDLQAPPAELTIRLTPQPAEAPEVVVSGSLRRSDIDTTWQALVRPGLTTPFGEASIIRALQPLPAVSLTGALANGLNVRGSRSDGFLVLLDGMPIYNQSHLFGTFDAFNAEALQRVGFFYGVAPADLSAPPGGTLSFMTRTGAQTGVQASVGLSNTALRGTVEGPLGGGRGSVLVAGRHSYMNAVSWLGSETLIAQGLSVDPQTSPLPGPAIELEDRILRADPPSARFYDLHGKAYYETPSGRRLTLSAYLGGDRTQQTGERLMVVADAGRLRDRLGVRPVETRNRWGNEAASLSLQQAWGGRAFSRTLLAVSHYHSTFRKDDFVYSRRERPADGLRNFVAPFDHQNELVEWKLEQQVDIAPAHPGLWTLGGTVHGYLADYAETSALRPEFAETRRSLLVDLFAQYDWTQAAWADVHLGLRTHYFTLGRHARISPRLKVELFPAASASVHLGYSRNHQFVHRLSLPTTSSADVWVTSNAGQAPGRADHVSAGLSLRPTATTTLQADAYVKTYDNVWQHETITALRRTDASVLFAPWTTDNRAFARGLELMHQQRWGPVRWTNSYAWAKVELQSDPLNAGARFPADWDRRHQFTTQGQVTRGPWTGALTWFYATGTPNPWAPWVEAEPDRLDAYHRLDATLQYRRTVAGVTLEATASVFNVYDRANPWYRDPVAVLARQGARRRISFRIVDVYDLGVQPAFNVSVRF